jgi:hypothetical protein
VNDYQPKDALWYHRPFQDVIAGQLGYPYVAYDSLDAARVDKDAIVILTGDYGGQIYLTCPVGKLQCSELSLRALLTEMGTFAWGDGEEIYFERARPDRFVSGGMGGGHVEDDVWIHRDFRNLFEVGVDILPDICEVIHGQRTSAIPAIVARLVAYLETVDPAKAGPDQINFGNVADIALALVEIAKPAAPALPVLRKLEASGKFRDSQYSDFNLADEIRRIEAAAPSCDAP